MRLSNRTNVARLSMRVFATCANFLRGKLFEMRRSCDCGAALKARRCPRTPESHPCYQRNPWLNLRLRRSCAAFSLVELTLALGVAAFCLLAAFGLMPIGVQTNRNATSQTAAASIMAAVAADLRGTPKAYDNTKAYNVGDTVLLSGNCYTATAVTTGHSPPNSTYWTNGSPCPQFGIIFGTCEDLYFDSQAQVVATSSCNVTITLPATAR